VLTKQDHIGYWVKTAAKDWKAVHDLYNTKNYLHSLFWAHLVLEKLLKAHWVKDNIDNTPPKIHRLNSILDNTKLQLPESDKQFLSEMNQFQLEGRYPDYLQSIYKLYKSKKTKQILDQVDRLRICLLKEL
jgi:HEPN domain-containing protein